LNLVSTLNILTPERWKSLLDMLNDIRAPAWL
jgi:hypothetical protein